MLREAWIPFPRQFLVSKFWEQKMFEINFLIPTLNKRSHTCDKGKSSSLQFGPEAMNTSPQKKSTSYKMIYRALDTFFGMTRSLNTVAQELGKYMSDSVRAWDDRWAKGATKLIKIISVTVGMEMKIIN